MTPVTDGAWDPGAIAVDGQPEKEFNLTLAHAVRERLARYPCKVILTREGDTALAAAGDLASELRNRANVGNKVEADLFLSLHHDNLTGKPEARGGSLWIWRDFPGKGVGHAPATDPTTGVPLHAAPQSYEIALELLPFVRDALAAHGIPWRSYGSPDGVCCADFGVLRRSNGKAVLLECFFGSSPEDVAIARRPEFIPDLAEAIAQGVAFALSLEPVEAPKEPAAPETYPATLVVNLVRHDGYQVVNGRTTGELRPLLDELKKCGYAVAYDPPSRTLTVSAPMANVAASGGGPNLAQ